MVRGSHSVNLGVVARIENSTTKSGEIEIRTTIRNFAARAMMPTLYLIRFRVEYRAFDRLEQRQFAVTASKGARRSTSTIIALIYEVIRSVAELSSSARPIA